MADTWERTASAWPLNRREFLKTAGAGLFLLFRVEPAAPATPSGPPPPDFNAYLRVGPDSRVACYTGKIEMGQGIVTSLAQMLAEELDVPLEAVDMVMGDTDLCPWDRGTFGSLRTRAFGPALRAAGAEARQVLLELAADRLHIPVAQLATENGTVFDPRTPGHRVAYGELVQGKTLARRVPATRLKTPPAFRVMGRPALRRDARAKVTGAAQFAADIRLPGMLHARILRPPAHGATLREADLSGAEAVVGARVLRDGAFIAVLHPAPDLAEIALAKIRAVWDVPEPVVDDQHLFPHLLAKAPVGTVLAEGGDLGIGERRATVVAEATYLNDYVAHAPMEPHAALVRLEGDRAMVWASTQAPFAVRDEVAGELGIPPANVHVLTPFVGGGFGGKTRNLQAVEAARCARLSGKPVQVAWTREEEFFYDSFRPAALVKIRSGVDDQGRLTFWDYAVFFAGDRGAPQFYTIPHHRTVAHGSLWSPSPGTHPFATGPWRAPSNNTNTFARESHLDELAAKAGIDPLDFRLRNLADPRMRRVLLAAGARFGWTPAKVPSGRGWGVACGADAGTYVATMAEVEVNRQTGAVQVKRVVCAQDMGWAVNPEGAALQMEGCITMGLGYALTEQVRFQGGTVRDRNFDTYEIPRFSWLPRIETVLVQDREAEPQGGGEPAIITMGAVLAAAVRDAVGARLRHLPMTPERVRAALSG